MDDLISRQAAIDALAIGEEILNRVLDEMDVVGYERKKYEWGLDLIKSYISDMKELPSAQPEIIRCRECKHMQEDKIFHQCWCNGREVKPDHFCGYAERKEDEVNSRNKTC